MGKKQRGEAGWAAWISCVEDGGGKCGCSLRPETH